MRGKFFRWLASPTGFESRVTAVKWPTGPSLVSGQRLPLSLIDSLLFAIIVGSAESRNPTHANTSERHDH